MKFTAAIVSVLAVAVSVKIVTAFSAQRTAEEIGSDSNSTKHTTCYAPIISNVHGRCPKPEKGPICFACIDQCRSDIDCHSPYEICCPTFGCGNGCQDRFGRFEYPKEQ